MGIIWIITIALAVLFGVLFLVNVIKKKRLLRDISDEAKQQAYKFKAFLKMAYPAALIYAVLYAVFVVLCRFEVFGPIERNIETMEEGMNAATWIPALLITYLLIWLLLHIIDMDCQSRDKPFATVLKSINTNTGVQPWNYVLLGISISVLIASLITLAIDHKFYICGPLFIAVLVSVLINLFVGSDADWNVKSPSEARWRPGGSSTPEKVKIKAASQDAGEDDKKTPNNPKGKTPVERRFKWRMKDRWGIDTTKEDDAVITLFKEDWEDPEQDMRKKNPFFGKDANGKMNWESAVDDMSNSVAQVITGPDTADETSEGIALETIVNSAIDVAGKYNLADYEVPELLLTLSQYGIEYKVDEDSEPINQFNVVDESAMRHLEYFRFASETLYDMEGDCDCKSLLACRLMKKLGLDAKLVEICDKRSANPNHAAMIFKDEYNRFKKCAKYPDYTYCEATSEGWKIGEIPEEMDENTINVLA